MRTMRGDILILTGTGLVVIGFLLIFIGALISSLGGGEVEGGGVIMIGPIPIVFGSGRAATLAMILAVILMVLWILGFLLTRRG